MEAFESVKVLNGVLYHSFYDTNGKVSHELLVLPRELRIPLLELVHNDIAGHLKGAKCILHVMRRAWWFGWKAVLNLFMKCCPECEFYHKGKALNKRSYIHLILDFLEKSSLLSCVGYFLLVMDITIFCLSFACLANLQFEFLCRTKTQVLLPKHLWIMYFQNTVFVTC